MPRAGLDREGVVAAAASIADAEGIGAVNLTRLAKALNVKPPSLYNHVAGLPDVLRELALQGGRQANARMSKAAVGLSRTDAVVAMGLAYRRFARAHPGLYAAAVAAPPAGDAELAQAASEAVETVVQVLAGFGLDGDDALHAVRGLRAIIHGFVSLEAAGAFGLALDVEDSLRRLLVAFSEGLMRAVPAARG